MVCPRCIAAIESIFKRLEIPVKQVSLGEVVLVDKVNSIKQEEIKCELLNQGFEWLEDHHSQLIAQIKQILIQQIHHQNQALKVNYSTLLANELKTDYSVLSKLFSSIEGITIERFVLKQKVEKVKELLFYNQMTLSEIAFQMHYSSVAHLSAQFKRETGMTPTAFRKLKRPGHQSLDSI